MQLAAFHVYVTGVCERAGARVVWDNPSATPRTDGKTVWIPKPLVDTDPVELMRLRYYIKHEACHVKYTDFPFWRKEKLGKTLHMVCNLLEDHRIDYLNDREYSGDARLSAQFWQDYASRIESMGTVDNPLAPIFLWESTLRDWIPTALLAHRAMLAGVSADVLTASEGLCRFSSRLQALRENPLDNEGLLSLARDILKELNLEEGSRETGAEEKKAGKGGESGESEPSLFTMPSDLEGIPGGETALSIDDEGLFIPFPVSSFKPAKLDGYVPELDIRETLEKANELSPSLTNKLRHMLQVRALSHYDYGKKRGKLMQGALASMVSTGNERVFKSKVEGQTLDVAVSILVDCSGSMLAYNKYPNAGVAVACLSRALSIVGVKHAVHGFSNSFETGEPSLYRFAGWDKPVNTKTLLDNMKKVALRDNADAEFILWAAHDLMQQKAARRILLVMSDGDPACGKRQSGLGRATKSIILEAAKHVQVLGLGMCHDVSPLYPKSEVAKTPEEIPSKLISLFSNSF